LGRELKRRESEHSGAIVVVARAGLEGRSDASHWSLRRTWGARYTQAWRNRQNAKKSSMMARTGNYAGFHSPFVSIVARKKRYIHHEKRLLNDRFFPRFCI
jgi:hypothetical protein